MSQSPGPRRITYAELGEPVGPYSHGVKHNGLLFLSGLTAFGTRAQGGSASEQLNAIFDQLRVVAGVERVTLSSLVKVTIFVTSFDEIASIRATLSEIYGGHAPASSLVQVAGLFSPDICVEVEAVVAVE